MLKGRKNNSLQPDFDFDFLWGKMRSRPEIMHSGHEVPPYDYQKEEEISSILISRIEFDTMAFLTGD